MRKSILLGLLCLVSVLAVACGGGNNSSTGNGTGCEGGCEGGDEGGSDASDAYALYKKDGRKWTHKSVTKIEGMDDMVSYMSYEIKDVKDDQATQVMTMLDKDKKPMAGMDPTETVIKFVVAEASGCATGDAPKIEYETVKVEGGEFECMVVEMSGTKSWTSKEFPGLLVKMEGATTSMELIEWSK